MKKQLILVTILIMINCLNAIYKKEMTHLTTLPMYNSEDTFTVFCSIRIDPFFNNVIQDSLNIIYVKSLADSFLTNYDIENGLAKFLSEHQDIIIDPNQYRVLGWGDTGMLSLKIFEGQMDSSYIGFTFAVYGPMGKHIEFKKDTPLYQTDDLFIFNRVLYIRKDE